MRDVRAEMLPIAVAAAALSSAARAIDGACDARFAASALSETFVAIYDGRPSDGRWRAADPASLRRIATDPDIYSETAYVRTANGRVAFVEIVSNSLDFGARSISCFRAAGTLARVVETSSGTTNQDRETLYLDERGRVVGRSSYVDLIAPRTGRSPSPDVKPAKIDVFRKVRALPFARLLPRSLLELRARLRELTSSRRVVRVDHVAFRRQVGDRQRHERLRALAAERRP